MPQTMIRNRDLATERQVAYMRDLCAQREVPGVEHLIAQLDAGTLTFGKAREYIPLLQSFPHKPRQTSANPVTEPGMYEHDGYIYRVKRSKSSNNLYAMQSDYTVAQLEKIAATKGTDEDPKIKVNFEYDRGTIFKIDASHRITVARAEELSALISNCIVCGRVLRAKESVARSIGPVCITRV
jgi:hypothetical protein